MRALINKILVVLMSISVLCMCMGCTKIDNLKAVQQTEKPQNTDNDKETDNSITIGVVDLDTYNPLATKSVTMQNMLGFIFEPLFTFDDEQNTIGVLAKSYNTAPDGKSITLNIKDNVIWHDGTSFSADDVIYTIKTILNSDSRYKNLINNIVSVSKINDSSLTVIFDRSIANPAALFSFPIIKNGSNLTSFKPVGTGPFYLDYDKLTSFEAYHGEKSNIQYVYVKSVPDNDKFVSLFNASVIDVADSSMFDMNEYTPRSNASVNEYVTNEMVFVGFNTQDSVFKFPEARRSIYEIINRKSIVSHIYFSRAKAAHYPINPTSRFYPNTAENMHSDHGAAEKELKDGKWKKDKRGVYFRADEKSMTYFSVEILVNSGDTERIKIAAEISETMSELGMKNTVTACSESEFSSRLQSGNYDMFIGKISLLPNNDITELISDGNTLNYSDDTTDILLTQLGTLTAENDKKDVYAQLFERVKEDCPIAPICFLKDSIITSAKIKSGVCPSVSGAISRTENWSTK